MTLVHRPRRFYLQCGLIPGLVLACWLVACLETTTNAQRGRRRVDTENTTVHKGLSYHSDETPRHQLDLYLPKSNSPTPLIVWIHGGGWRAGSKDGGAPGMGTLLGKGFAVACINYRLSTDATFPSQIEDCKAAIRWLKTHAEQYNLDPQRLGVFGSSAGGHLAALVGTSGGVDPFEKGENLKVDSRVQAVCDFYGPTDLEAFVKTPGYERHAEANSPEALLLGGTVAEKPEVAQTANPITYVSKDDPPFLIVHGTKDGTVPPGQSELLFESLEEHGVPVHWHELEGAGHGGPAFADPEVLEMVVSFFEKRLSKETTNEGEESAKHTTAKATQTERNPNANRAAGRSFQEILSRFDQNNDQKLSREEAPAFLQQANRFQRLDTNGDGFLDESEHQEAQRMLQRNGQRSGNQRSRGQQNRNAGNGNQASRK